MNIERTEQLLGTAKSIDFFAEKGFVLLLYENPQQATEAFYALLDLFPFERELVLHVQYKYDETVDLSIIEKSTANTVKVNNLNYANGNSSYINMNHIADLASSNTDLLNNFVLFAGSVLPNESYDVPYLPELIAESRPGLNITGYTAQFIPKK